MGNLLNIYAFTFIFNQSEIEAIKDIWKPKAIEQQFQSKKEEERKESTKKKERENSDALCVKNIEM